jgi:hypothetical protein
VVVGARRAGMVAVVLAGLTMGLAFAHTLELPQKLDYDAATWTRIQHSLYRYFAVIGGPLEVATVLAAVVFAVRAHRLRGGGWPWSVLSARGCPGVVVYGVEHGQRRGWSLGGGCGAVGLASLAGQREFGHGGHFVVTFAGFLALLDATVRVGAPDHRPVLGRS